MPDGTVPQLLQRYWEVFSEEFLDFEEFLERVAAGTYGSYTREEILAFIDAVEEITLRNIDSKAQEGPQYAAMRDQVLEETQERFRALRARYAPASGC